MSAIRTLDQAQRPAYWPRITGDDWDGKPIPNLDWMVEGMFLRGTVAMMSGDAGLGKTLLCQQLLTASALGKPWLGMPTVQANALGFLCEDPPTVLHRNQHFINRFYQTDMSHLSENWALLPREGMDNELFEFKKFSSVPEPTSVWHQLVGDIRRSNAQMVILDTAADVFAGNEIDRLQVRRFITQLRRLAVEIQGCIILTKHPSRGGKADGSGESGSTGWDAHVRSRVYLTTEKGGATGERVLKQQKLNQGPRGGVTKLVWSNGVFVRQFEAPEPEVAAPAQGDMWWRET